ncbi:MAG: N-acetylneuraminate synthase [Syntrophorhabdaceae bacterium]
MSNIYIIAEAGVNHNGSRDLALRLCREARNCNADAVKFQTFKTEKLLTKQTAMAQYQEDNIGTGKTQYEMAKELELSYEDFTIVKKYCDSLGIDFLSTPDEEDSLDFLVSLGLETLKIGSGEVTNVPFLRKVASKGLDIILSTGMSTMAEVENAYGILVDNGARSVSLLHCTSDYPCSFEDVNLRVIDTLKKTFNTRIGYSDHTRGIEISLAAAAMGAQIIEKHFTLDRTLPGPDHVVSLEPGELKVLVEKTRNIEIALGDGIKEPTPAELRIRPLVRKNIVASKRIKTGEVFTHDNLTTKRSSQGIGAENWDTVVGLTARQDYDADEAILL